MSEQTITLSRALVELKTIEDRIKRASIQKFFSVSKGTGENMTLSNGMSVEDFTKSVTSNLDKLNDLIVYRNKLKQLVVETNSKTKITIGNKEMTIAGAIEQKAFLSTRREVLQSIRKDLRDQQSRFDVVNTAYELDRNQLLHTFDEKASGADLIKTKLEIQEIQSKPELFDPKNVVDYLNKLEEELIDFEVNVDVALSEINATTKITL